MHDLLLYNALIVNEGRTYTGWVAVNGDIIVETGEGIPAPDLIASAAEAVDLEGCSLLPGVIDDQVHFRDPGLTHKGDIATESHAAVAGGVTSFMDMPNTKPPTVTLDTLEEKLARGADVSVANYSFFIGATNDNIDQLMACDYSRVPGVKLFLGSSTGNMLVDHEEALERIFRDVPALIAIHSEDEATIKACRDRYEAEMGKDVPVKYHPLIRSREACVISTTRAIERARRLGTRLHVLHVSTADEARMFTPGPVTEKLITAEVCVHHLWFSDDEYDRLGTRIKMNPAVKTADDRAELRKALCDDRLDIVATDHAPHLLSEKTGGALTAASGAPMVQYSLPVMLELADMGVFTAELVVEKMCHAPAELYRIDRRGYIRPGYYADMTVVKRGCAYQVNDSDVVGRCGWTPLCGTTLHNKVISTYVNGKRVYHRGVFDENVRGRELRYLPRK